LAAIVPDTPADRKQTARPTLLARRVSV